MRILMLCPLLSSSAFITTYPLAKILSKEHEVKIVGPLFGKEPFIKDKGLDIEVLEPTIKQYQLGLLSLYRKNLRRLMIGDYDVAHAFKLLPHTAPAAAAVKTKLGKKFVLSIDDWDAGASDNPVKRFFLKRAERAAEAADETIVSTTGLQKIYGGHVIYQVANEPLFIHKRRGHMIQSIRKRYGLEDKIVVLHAGTIYPHKGLDILIEVIRQLNTKEDLFRLVLLGSGRESDIKRFMGKETIFLGQVPMEKVPDFVAACDIYAIPTKDTPYARVQLSAKIFEAMMQERAIVASDISDNRKILDGGRCGLLVKPGDVSALKSALLKLAEDKALRGRLGKAARARYLKEYSYANVERKIKRIYKRLE